MVCLSCCLLFVVFFPSTYVGGCLEANVGPVGGDARAVVTSVERKKKEQKLVNTTTAVHACDCVCMLLVCLCIDTFRENKNVKKTSLKSKGKNHY